MTDQKSEQQTSPEKDSKVYADLLARATFEGEDTPQNNLLNQYALHQPGRLQISPLQKTVHGEYRLNVLEKVSSESYEVSVPVSAANDPEFLPFFLSADEKDSTQVQSKDCLENRVAEKKEITLEEEAENIKREFNLDEILNDIKEGKHRGNPHWKMKEIKYNCASNAHKTNSLEEACLERAYAIVKTVGTIFPVVAAGLIGEKILGCDNMGEMIRYSILSAPLTIPIFYLTRLLIFGNHPISGCGNYFQNPIFGAANHFELSKNWKKIAKLQDEGKLRKGIERAPEDRYQQIYYSVHGGP